MKSLEKSLQITEKHFDKMVAILKKFETCENRDHKKLNKASVKLSAIMTKLSYLRCERRRIRFGH